MYVVRQPSGDPLTYQLVLLTSSDMINWVNRGTALSLGASGQWDDTGIYRTAPTVDQTGKIILDPTYNMIQLFYSAENTAYITKIGIAYTANYTTSTTQCSLTIYTVGQGTVSPGNGTYLSGTSVDIEAINAAGWVFAGWSAGAPGSANTTLTTNGPVTVKTVMPKSLADLSGVTYNGLLYTFGGYGTSATNYRADVLCYNPSSDSWTVKRNMTYARWGGAAVLYGDVVYVFGGSDGASNNRVEAYNITSNTWTTKSNLNSNLAGQGQMAVTVGSTIYIFYHKFTYAYNPATDTYTQKVNATIDRTWCCCGYVNVNGEDRIYLIGGFDYTPGNPNWGSTNVSYYYRPSNNDWSIAQAQSPYIADGIMRDNPVINGLIYFGFGLNDTGHLFYSSIYAYNPSSNTWSAALASGFYPRDGLACGVINNKLYAVGGRNLYTSPVGLNYVEEFDPALANTTVTMSGPVTVTATFTQSQYALTMFTVGQGTVSPGNGTYLSGTNVDIKAFNAAGWTFAGWSGDASGYANTSVTMSGNKVVTATFTQNSTPLSVSVTPAGVSLQINQSQSFTATVTGGAPPYSVQWINETNSVVIGTGNSYNFTSATAGTYKIHATATDSFGSIASSTTVIINVTASQTRTFGYASIGASSDSEPANYMMGCKFSATEAGTVTKISAYIRALSGTANVRVAIYSDNSGVPGTLLAQSGAVSVGTTASWVNFTLSCNVSASASYWLILQWDSSITIYFASGATSQFAYTPQSYASGFPNSWTRASYTNWKQSIYATYTSIP